MDYSIKKAKPANLRTACLVVPVFSGSAANDIFKSLDTAAAGQLKKLQRKADFKATSAGKQLAVFDVPGIAADRVVLLAGGERNKLSAKKLAGHYAAVISQLNTNGGGEATLLLPAFADKQEAYTLTRAIIIASEAALYRFDACKSDVKVNKRPLKRIGLLASDSTSRSVLEKAIAHGQAIANGENLARELANLPGNICTPTYLAEQARQVKRGVRKMRVSVLEEKDMEKLGMGSLLSVSRGSRQPAKLIVMEYRGAAASQKPVVLVGKGLTFDAGGISIKPSAKMDEMKYDMCGGASVLGTLQACAELDLPLNVVGLVPSSENLPDGDANKPGDIVTSMSGQTIEILNTDAEGRLILCDTLTYAERYEPAAVIDIATLTGACIVALGNQASGLMSNDDNLADEILAAGEATGDRAWQLPLWDEYQAQLDSNFADMANIGGPGAGTITAACFLSRYAKKYKWAHLDIAGTAWISGGKDKGATGRPVSLLTQVLLKRAKLA